MANGVTTEWFDIHVKLGNYLPLDKVPTSEEIAKKNVEMGESVKKEELKKQANDDDEMDEFERKYYNQRKAELVEYSKLPKFGSLYYVSKEDYISQITQASVKSTVVVHLYESQYAFN